MAIADLNPTIGTEPGKIRPVIIIQTDLLNKYHPSSIICPITTNVRKEIEILRIHLKKGCCGLEEYSTPQNSDHWLSLPKDVTLSVDYESKKKKIYCSI